MLNFKKAEQLDPAYLAVNPMGKVPAVKHGDALVTEQVAVFLYLADLYPEAGLTPAIGDPLARTLPALDGVLRIVLRARAGRSRAEAGAGAARR